MIVRLQSLGYLPSKPVTVVGDIFHHTGDSASELEDLNRQIAELGKMANGNDPLSQEIKVDVEAIKKLADEIKTQINEKTEENDYGNE
jgi:cytochrome c556